MPRNPYPPGHKARVVCPCGWATTRRKVTRCSSCKRPLAIAVATIPTPPRTQAERDATIEQMLRANREAALR